MYLNDTYALDLATGASTGNFGWSKLEVDGKLPAPRWRHTANALKDGRLFVFGGIGEKTRYNDVAILDVEAESPAWVDPAPTGVAPSPRSYHTATMCQNKIYIFGGYGGHGMRRQNFNDLHVYDPEANAWLGEEQGIETDQKEGGIKCEGEPPCPRGNHSTSVIEHHYLLVMGGRDTGRYLDDCHVLDTETFTWTQIRGLANPAAPDRICSHVAAGLVSVPSFKVFCFGGQTGSDKVRTEWSFRNKVDVLDCSSMTWLSSPGVVAGTPPPPREDAAWAFDPKTAKLVMFGGWANDWLSDLHMLDVSGIVGPPYAVTALVPNEGPMTGKSEVIIKGLEFTKGKITVKFTDGRNEEISEKADYLSPTEIKCLSPDWSKFSPGEVDVRVSIGGEGLTVNRIKWNYYVNTKPQKCVAYGPGLFEKGGLWGFPAIFKIQAKDTSGRNRSSGGEGQYWICKAVSEEGEELECKIVDNNDGTYDVSYIPRSSGSVEVSVAYNDPVQNGIIPIRGSPWKSSFDNPWTKCKMSGAVPKVQQGMQLTTLQKKLVLYGGGPGVNILDAEQLKWEAPEIEGSPPEDRSDFSFTTLDNEKMLIFGGVKPVPIPEGDQEVEQGPLADFDDVHLLLCEKGTWKWAAAPEVSGEKPAIRARHSACLIPVGKKVVVFGGVGAEAQRYDDIHILSAQNAAKMEWMTLPKHELTPEEAAAAAAEAGEGPAADGAAAQAPEAAAPAEPAADAQAEAAPAAPAEGAEAEGGDAAGEAGEGAAPPAKAEGEEEEEEEETERVLPPVNPGSARMGAGTAVVEGKVYLFGGDATHSTGEEFFTNVLSIGTIAADKGPTHKTIEKDDDITWHNCQVTGDIPPARADFVMTVMDGKIVVYGGFDMDGMPIDDMYAFDPETSSWSCMYRSDGSTCPPKPMSAFVQKRLFTIAGSRSTYDDVRVLEFGKISEASMFVPKMTARVQEELEKLAAFEDAALANLSVNPNDGDTEDKQRDLLLQVNSCIFEFKLQQPAIELQLDVLRDAVNLLQKQGVNMDKPEVSLNEAGDKWAAVKKQAPIAKEAGKNVQEREALKIKKQIEDFELRVKGLEQEFRKKPFFSYETGVPAAYESVIAARAELLKSDAELADLASYARIFEFPELMDPSKQVQEECHKQLGLTLQLWHMIDMINYNLTYWNSTLWDNINCEEIEDGTKVLFKQLRATDKNIKVTNAYAMAETNVKNFLSTIPLVSDLRHPSMRDRHWNMLMDLTGVKFVIDDKFKLSDLIALQLHNFEDDVGEIVNRAQKEEKMEQALKKIGTTWVTLEFVFTQHKDTDVQLIKLSEEDFETLEDHQLQVQNMMGSRYLSTFEEEVTGWQSKLSGVADVVTIMNEIQRTWAYLETLFIGSEEVKKELPEDTERFAGIDVDVKRVLKNFFEIKNASKACNEEGVFKLLEETQHKLELCEKSLANYLEQKRRIFPRFYFVSTSDLLDILSNGNQPDKVNFHMPKIIAAVDHLDLEPGATSSDRPTATGFESCVGVEHIDFGKPLKITGRVEFYLQDIQDRLIESLRTILYQSIKNYEEKATVLDWLKITPNQIILTVSLLFFTKEMTAVFGKMTDSDNQAMKNYWQFKVDALTDLIDLVRTDLSKADRMKAMCLITLDAHSRDITLKLYDFKVTDINHFEWQSQLRFEWRDAENDCFIMIVDAEFRYGFEYIGNGARLVITPLTDRIYVTATQALKLCMGCAPAGPAGTGKTETTKDLGAMLAKCIYVFNCAPEMDYKSMGDIWKGLGASGAWGCFDEFNRLIAEVLSVCSTQYKAILDAIVAGRKTFVLEGAELKLDVTCGAYITMNPGYIGRTPLPESLKVLFRPVTVVVPDFALIAENMLMAEGFTEAKVLGKKFINLYELCRDLLSKAMHYDWGLRAIKSVLRVAGDFKRSEPEKSETTLLFRSLRDFNLPKIVGDDLIIFMGLLGDLFPGAEAPRQRDWDLEKKIEESFVEAGLQPEDEALLKTVQLMELLAVRHCDFIMGTSGTGKSTCWKILAAANGKRGLKTTVKDLDPKAILTTEFYGYINLATREWKDGIFSLLLREAANAPGTDPKWIILDGDLDANWIESMNSVMDDNKLLTLASNERIVMKPHMRLIFELRDLKYATPATSSRAGVLFIMEDKQWWNFVQTWVMRRTDDSPERKQFILELFQTYVPDTLFTLKKEFRHMLQPTLNFNMVQTLTRVLEGLYTPENLPKGLPNEQVVLETYFVFACVWAFGSGFSISDGVDMRKNYSTWWKQKWTKIKLPTKGSVFDFFVDKATLKFTPWAQVVPSITYESSTPMDSVTVPTGETQSITFFLDLLVELRYPALLVGLAGAGKTAMINGKLRSLPEDYMTLTTNFNYYTDGAGFRAILESPLEKKAGRNFGPPGNLRLVYFVDDLNMPQLDPYETQYAISLLRQYMDYQHWYDMAKLQLRVIQNVQFLSAMNPTCGSFVVNPRLQRHYMVFAIGFPGSEALMTIFSTFLKGHLVQFDSALNDEQFAHKLIQAALELHNKVAQTFRKTAINFHYEFSIRHLASVFKGLLMSEPAYFQEPAKFASLFIHEAERVYGDRLVSTKDLESYLKIAKDVGKKYFKDLDQSVVFPQPLIFCHCWKDLDEKSYNKVENIDTLSKILNSALTSYNETNAAMNLVLFEDAMKHVCRCCRILQSSHALLVGVGGMGKQSLCRLSAFICNSAVSQIAISGTYGMSDLKEDIKQMYFKAGLKNESIVFLFQDSQIADEKFLVYLNELLSSGKIPGLFAADEVDTIYNSVRNEGKGEGIADAKDPMFDFFISKIKKNLHMCLCFSPVGEAFRRRASRFPSLINCTVIDWFQPWPENALLDVAKRFLDEVDLGAPNVKEAITAFMPYSFGRVNEASAEYLAMEKRYNYTTPKSFLELIYLYKNMLASKREQLEGNINRLSNGLTKLETTAKDVAVLMEQVQVKSVEVEAAARKADEVAEVVGGEKAKVEVAASAANEEAAKTAVIAEGASKMQADCERDLAAAIPAVEKAEAALDTLNKKDLGELKSLAKPPAGVDDVTAAVLALRGEPAKNRDWNAAKNMMKDVNKFIEDLKAMKGIIDSSNLPAKNVDGARPYLALEHIANLDIMKKKSTAAAGLCDFLINIVMYYDIVVTVEPKRNALKQAQEELNDANTKLAEVQAHVADLESKLAVLIADFDRVVAEKNAVVAEGEKLQNKLALAQRLMNALGSEQERWAVNVEQMKADSLLLPGDVLIASAFVSYVGCFSKKFRTSLLDVDMLPYIKKNAIPMSESADPLLILTDTAQIAGWNSEGLPSDRVSIENGAITTYAERWPLMIDPQLQGIVWVKEKESKNNLQITRLTNKKMLPTLEKALETGSSVMIENLQEALDAVIGPIVGRQKIKKGRNFFVKVGDKEVEYHNNFKLILHTKLANPHYPPEVQAECTLINFMVTEDGLEDQLLAKVVTKERPDLEEEKSVLIKQQNEFTVKLKELEDDLLRKLAEAEGDITEDVQLIESLEDAKRMSNEISEKVIIAKETEITINKAREDYRGVANRGALLFFALGELFKVHTFYHYSLAAFTAVFLKAIDLAGKKYTGDGMHIGRMIEESKGKNPFKRFRTQAMLVKAGTKNVLENGALGPPAEIDLPKRLKELTYSITYQVYNFTRRGLFDEHKLLFVTSIFLKILQRNPEVSESEKKEGMLDGLEVAYITRGTKNMNPPTMNVELGTFLSETVWQSICGLSEVPAFNKLVADIEGAPKLWDEWLKLEQPELTPPPGEYANMNPFQKVCLLRATRPDRVTAGLRNMIYVDFGKMFIDEEAFNIFSIYRESAPQTAMFFYLFAGADIVGDIDPLLKKKGYSIENGQFVNISMGQGQEPVAEEALDRCMKEGGWVFLQNIHLMSMWVKALERKLEQSQEGAHPDFRCFLSSEPPPLPTQQTIPEAILQNSIKVSNQPAQSLRANLLRAWQAFDQNFIDKCQRKSDFPAVLLSLCCFHALVNGRRKFGFIGWSCSNIYGFTMGDLQQCAQVTINMLNARTGSRADEDIPYADLKYIFGEIMYGGHITDKWDRRTNVTYLETLVIPKLFEDGHELFEGFKSKVKGNWEDFMNHIDNNLPPENPVAFGLHPNADISFLQNEQSSLFRQLIEISGGGGGAAGLSKEAVIEKMVVDFLERLPDDFNLFEIKSRIGPSENLTPYLVVLLQECEKMNGLLGIIRKSLVDLQLGLQGALNISDMMDQQMNSMFLDRIPAVWEKAAWRTLKSLPVWFVDLLERITQFNNWQESLKMPPSVWLSGTANPMAFVTAVMQTTARAYQWPLDDVETFTDITKMDWEEATAQPEEGAYVHGIYIEGARWDREAGELKDSILRELAPQMPIIHLKAIPTKERRMTGYYDCPVYYVSQRGGGNPPGSYVFFGQLRTSTPTVATLYGIYAYKWVLAGVGMLLQVD